MNSHIRDLAIFIGALVACAYWRGTACYRKAMKGVIVSRAVDSRPDSHDGAQQDKGHVIQPDEIVLADKPCTEGRTNIAGLSRNDEYIGTDCTEPAGDGGRPHYLFDTFWKALYDWANVTTFHGIRMIFDKETHIVRRAIWLLLVTFFVFLLLWLCHDQLNRYLEYNTLNKHTVTFEETLVFPAVTVCSYNLIRNDSVHDARDRLLLKNIYMAKPNRTFLIQELGEDYLRSAVIEDMFKNGSMPLSELFLLCQWEASGINCVDHFKGRITDAGYCYTFNAIGEKKSFVTKLPGSKYGLDMMLWTSQNNYFISAEDSAGFKILVHDRGEDPDMGFATALAPGFTHYIAVNKHEVGIFVSAASPRKVTAHFSGGRDIGITSSFQTYHFLPYPVKAFDGQECVDTKSEPYLYLTNYTVHGCIQECKADFIYSRCGCVGVLDSVDIGTRKVCGALAIIDCYNQAILDFASNAIVCNCPMPCDVKKFEMKVSSAYFPTISFMEHGPASQTNIRDNIMMVRVFFDNKEFTKHEQLLEFTIEDMWGSLGGYFGLTVGVSVVTFLEIFEMLFMNVVHYFFTVRKIARGDV